jgi:hypothetical protein
VSNFQFPTDPAVQAYLRALAGGFNPNLDPTQTDAWAILQGTLTAYGFSGADLLSLQNFIKSEIINGRNTDQITLDLEASPEFANRFPAIIERRQKGLPPISPSDYVSLERTYQQLERSAGLPPQMFDAAHYDTLIANDVSASEYGNRVQQGVIAANQAPQETRDMLLNYYGVTPGQLAAHFLDPAKVWPVLQQQFAAAGIGGAAQRVGFNQQNPVSEQEAMRLAQLGVTPEQAQQGFMELYHQRQLYGTLPGQSQTGLTTDQLLGAEFGGDEVTKELLQRRALEQQATFQAGGQFQQTQAGTSGLGAVTR